ncbi:MAG: thioredoxin-related protein [Granulosicoccus sp.]|jgi:thioredoxin-related protein
MQIYEYLKHTVQSSILALIFLFGATAAQSAELLMVEEPGCVYCARFNREIGPAYPKTEEGKLAPLRRLQIADPWPEELEGVRKASVTPTFILVDNGMEIDRLVGYPGDEHFWFLLSQMLGNL